jgi:malonyl-CoA O-methyltransferase
VKSAALTVSKSSAGADLAMAPAARCVSALEGHELWAATYDQAPNPMLALEERTLERMLPALAGKAVLDIACGTGRWLRKLRQRGARVSLGMDLSYAMLRQASRQGQLEGMLVRGDACALPYRSGVADLVVSSFAVGYIDDLRGFADELARVARPGSEVFISDFHPSNHSRGWRRSFRSGEEILEIRSYARPVAQICEAFGTHGLRLEARIEACFDEPEKALFVRSGKGRFFETARSEPAIFVCRFRRQPVEALKESSL